MRRYFALLMLCAAAVAACGGGDGEPADFEDGQDVPDDTEVPDGPSVPDDSVTPGSPTGSPGPGPSAPPGEPPGGPAGNTRCERICNQAAAMSCDTSDCSAACATGGAGVPCFAEALDAYECVLGLGICIEDIASQQEVQPCLSDLTALVLCSEAQDPDDGI